MCNREGLNLEKPEVESFKREIIDILKDDTRLQIFLSLMVNAENKENRTLKSLSDQLNKGKTTIHHHIRKMEQVQLILWEENVEEARQIKTRYYELNLKLLKALYEQLDE